MGDRIAILEHGQLRQYDSPRSIYDRPSHRFVATFVGNPPMNLLPCQIERDAADVRIRPIGCDRTISWSKLAPPLPPGWEGTTRVFDLGIRPEAISLRQSEAAPDVSSVIPTVSARIARLEFNGPDSLATLTLGPHRLIARLPTWETLQDRQRVELVLDLAKVVWFDQETGEAL
jgi:ABC-type sugar transport system ATPase subunit